MRDHNIEFGDNYEGMFSLSKAITKVIFTVLQLCKKIYCLWTHVRYVKWCENHDRLIILLN